MEAFLSPDSVAQTAGLVKCHSVWPRIWQEAAKNMSEAPSYYPGPPGGQPPQRAEIHRLAQAQGKTDEWLTEGTVREFRGGRGENKKYCEQSH